MTLYEFVRDFVAPNTLIRLVTKVDGGHAPVIREPGLSHDEPFYDWDKVSMEWEILNHTGIYGGFAECEVRYITDIVIRGHHAEAINICIVYDPTYRDMTGLFNLLNPMPDET